MRPGRFASNTALIAAAPASLQHGGNRVVGVAVVGDQCQDSSAFGAMGALYAWHVNDSADLVADGTAQGDDQPSAAGSCTCTSVTSEALTLPSALGRCTTVASVSEGVTAQGSPQHSEAHCDNKVRGAAVVSDQCQDSSAFGATGALQMHGMIMILLT